MRSSAETGPRAGTILAADPNEAQRQAMASILGDAGFAVLEAASGEQALALLAQNPALVILDVHLPDMDSLELCRRIKLQPPTSKIPVLQIAGATLGQQDIVQGLMAGPDACLAQPLHASELLAVVNALLRIRRAEQEAQHRATEAEHARAQLQAVLEAMGEGLCQLDAQARLTYMNPAAERILGYRASDVNGCRFHELVHPSAEAHLDGIHCPLLEALNNGGALRPAQDYFRRKDDRLIPVEYTTDPLVVAGTVTGVMFSFRDISERQQAEGQCFLLLLREQRARWEAEAKVTKLEEQVRRLSAEVAAVRQKRGPMRRFRPTARR